MEKKQLGLVIAGISIASAFSVKFYNKYKDMKSESPSDEKTDEPNLTDEELGGFDITEILNEDKVEDKVEDEFDFNKIVNDLSTEVEDQDEFDIKELLDEKEDVSDIEKKDEFYNNGVNVVNLIETVIKKDQEKKALVQENKLTNENSISSEKTDVDSSIDANEPIENKEVKVEMPDYKNMDVNDPKYWDQFDTEIQDK